MCKWFADDAPADITARGPSVVRVYQSACESSGTQPSYRVKVVNIGRDAVARKRLQRLLAAST